MKKKILVVDDSALMRRVVCDIITSDDRFEVGDIAGNGLEALELLSRNAYDAVVLDVVMPQMDGLTVLKELNKRQIRAKVVMNSTLTKEGADVTLQALDEGAMDFVHKPNRISDAKGEYREQFLTILDGVSKGRYVQRPSYQRAPSAVRIRGADQEAASVPASKGAGAVKGKKIVAIASSTGGPKALQYVVPKFPQNLNAPVVIVQHMPAGFTASLAERLNALSAVSVKEAADGDILKKGHVYIAKGGAHLKIINKKGICQIAFSNEPPRQGVRPCANYMYESLADSDYDEICCVVMTGMGADGTEGIMNLKKNKNVHVIAQSEETCAVYGMPRSIVKKELADEILPLEEIAGAVTKNVGVQ